MMNQVLLFEANSIENLQKQINKVVGDNHFTIVSTVLTTVINNYGLTEHTALIVVTK